MRIYSDEQLSDGKVYGDISHRQCSNGELLLKNQYS